MNKQQKKKANNKTSFKSPSEPRCDVGRIGQEKKTTIHTTYPHILDDFFHKDLIYRENWEKSSNKGFTPSAQTPLPFHLLGTTGISVAFAGPEGCPILVTTVTSQGVPFLSPPSLHREINAERHVGCVTVLPP